MSLKRLSVIGAIALASQAQAIPLNITDFTYGSAIGVDMTGTDGSPSYDGSAGQFVGAFVDGSAAGPAARLAVASTPAPSFFAWCVELTQYFSFGITYDYTPKTGAEYFGAAKANDLSRLFTAAQGFVVDRRTSGALQAAIWEIVYEHGSSFSLTDGTFRGAPENYADQAAFDTVNGFLIGLASYQPYYQLEVLQNGLHQDFVVATRAVLIPEPGTLALLAAGLGVAGLLARRRRPKA